jgi:transcriptional regulator with XRE-family HTH domain
VSIDHDQATLLLTLAENIRRERTRLKMTQEQLAEKADLNIRTVQKIEAGNLNILVSTADRLRAALGISWNRLLAR